MKVKIQCPSCQKTSVASESLIGRKVTCPRCKASFAASKTIDSGPGDTNGAVLLPGDGPFPSYPHQFGRYTVLKKLGQGGMGAVYQAIDTQLDRLVALKLPTVNTAKTDRFIREAKACAKLMHPNICPVYDVGTIDGHLFISMAFIEGEPLENRIDPDSPMSEREAAEIVYKVALAMQEAHDNGIVHRDLKPANIMMNTRGEPVVMDFGLAKQVSETDADEAKLTRAGAVLGTPSYMSPEQVKGDPNIGPATDVYSLGVILYEMLTGSVPYRGVQTLVLAQIISQEVPLASATRPHITPGLNEVCRRAMAKDPNSRLTGMKEFAASINGAVVSMRHGAIEHNSQIVAAGTVDSKNMHTDNGNRYPFTSLLSSLQEILLYWIRTTAAKRKSFAAIVALICVSGVLYYALGRSRSCWTSDATTFTHESGVNWIEIQKNGKRIELVETSRTAEYIEILTKHSNISVRMYDNMSTIRMGGGEFVYFLPGKWR